MMVTMTKEEIEKLTRIKNRILDMLVISEDNAYNFAHTCLTCGLDFVKRKRNEQDILAEFEKLGYEVIVEKDHIRMSGYEDVCIYVDLENKSYSKNKYLQAEDITLQEHKLLSELFEVWGWN